MRVSETGEKKLGYLGEYSHPEIRSFWVYFKFVWSVAVRSVFLVGGWIDWFTC